ncbi:MAG: MurR/RpiR family transcriptional regulator [Oscillospiraceae bacterium]|nr:MurR/RpiR family transcriptional regulator [Oscillospiraceae bacterium]
MNERNINILERLHSSYYQLSAAERKVADYVLSQYSQVQFMSITQLAEECGVAEATVSRFCRSLALKGFNAFKMEIAKHTATSTGRIRDRQVASDSLEGRSISAGQLSQEAIQQTLDLLQPKDLEAAVALFEKSNRVFCMGSGGSMIMAQELAHLFSTITNKFVAVSDSHTQVSAAATADPTDAIVLFSYSGATHNGIAVLELAKVHKIPTVLVTRYPKSPAAQLADIVLYCGSNETPFQFGSIPAKVAQLVLMDILFQEYLRRNREKSEENLQRIGAALSEKHI